MIENWKLRNFKSVYDEVTLEFAPLTIFSGANSSGKSTLIQSLLLATQTLQSPVHSRSVVLNGHIVRLGTFDDVVSNGRQGEQVKIGFRLKLHEAELAVPARVPYGRYFGPTNSPASSLRSVECQFTFGAGTAPHGGRELLRLQPRLESSSVVVSAQIADQIVTEEVEIERSSISPESRLQNLKLPSATANEMDPGSLEYEVVKPETLRGLRRYYRMPAIMKAAGVKMRHFMPDRIWAVYDSVQEQSRRLVEVLLDVDEMQGELSTSSLDMKRLFSPAVQNVVISEMNDVLKQAPDASSQVHVPSSMRERFMAAVTQLGQEFNSENLHKCYRMAGPLRRTLIAKLNSRADELRKIIQGEREPEYRVTATPLPEVAETGVEYVQQYFSRLVKYLGPLRDEPKPVYPLAGATDPRDVGYRGEHTAAVLELYRAAYVEYVATVQFSTGNSSLKRSRATLHDAVLDWLQYMGVIHNVRTQERGSLGHELKVSTSGRGTLHDLTHVGVGVSQVLPIVVLSLLAEPGALLVFEQPELHLHPRVQTRLADFFVSMTLLHKQCVVETHSEYLINQLRYRSVVSDDDSISNKVIIYFVEKSGQASLYKPIRISRHGVIDEWPRGFFDESEDSARRILQAAMAKRARAQGGTRG